MSKWKQSYSEGRSYREEWEKDHKWLGNRGGSCYCKLCKCTINTMKKSNLVLHEGTVKHRKASESVLKSDSNLMKKFCTKSTDQRDQVKALEVKCAVGIACHGGISSVDHYTEIVGEFIKGQPLENMKLHRTKCSAILNNIVSISILEELISELKTSKYSLLIDESTNIVGSKHLCLCARFFSEQNSCIETAFLALIPVNSTTGAALYGAIENFF